jgi:hypothetical protein
MTKIITRIVIRSTMLSKVEITFTIHINQFDFNKNNK